MSNPPPGVIPLTNPVPQQLRRFGKYLLVHKLAEGGMAEIHLAKHVAAEGFERDVVVKVMKEHLSSSREFVNMFLDEARLAARLFHPNIVQITDLGVADGRYFICMEYLPGEDLQAIIDTAAQKGEQVPLKYAVRIIHSACEGLEYAHHFSEGGKQVGLVHRDVSPSNIIVTYQGTVKVLDFGIAKASSRFVQTQPGTVKGKLGYMSPEQARGEPLDARADVFSLGVTLHELLTGRRIFQKDSDVSILLAMMQQPIPSPRLARPEIPIALEAIVMRAVEKDREQRYRDAGELRTDLELYMQSDHTTGGTSHLAAYLKTLFGPEQVHRRTQLATLKELASGGFIVPPDLSAERITGFEPTLVRGSGTVSAPVMVEGKKQAPPTDIVAPLPPEPVRRRAVWPWVVLGLVVLLGTPAAGIATGLIRIQGLVIPGLTPRDPVVTIGADAGGAAVVADTGGAATETTDAGIQAADSAAGGNGAAIADATDTTTASGSDTGTTDPASGTGTGGEQPADATVKPVDKTQRPAILLGNKQVVAVLGRNKAQLTACGQKFRTELPADNTVKVLIDIANSGDVRVARVTTPGLDGTALSRCLETRLRALKFPRNRNRPELAIELPLKFNPAS